jgi:hypothetical protein
MRVSVVIPLYNKGKYLGRAVSSVLAQTFKDFELIIVNDGSTDDGPAVARKYADSRINVIDQDNQGASAARNRGVAAARGELIAFLDADDEWRPDFLATIAHLVERFPGAGAYATGWRHLRGGGRYCYRDISVHDHEQCGCYFDRLAGGGGVHTSSVAVRRGVFERLGAFRVEEPFHEDLDMWFRIALHYDFAYSPRICSLYHAYIPDNACHTGTYGKYVPVCTSLREMRADPMMDVAVRAKAERYAAAHLARVITVALLRGTPELVAQRLRQYRDLFGVTPAYIRLLLLHSVPRPLLRPAILAALSLSRGCLSLRNAVLSRTRERPSA